MLFSFSFTHGLLKDLSANPFPTRLASWHQGTLKLSSQGTHFGYVYEGAALVHCASGKFSLQKGMYFSVPNAGYIEGQGKGIVITSLRYQGFFLLGGPVESKGRLRYIDGCTDSLLLAPPMLGDPCLNLLHIPPYTKQTQHTHPSLRLGVIIKGKGFCHTPEQQHPLHPGVIFHIPENSQHSFHTTEEALLVLAYHPDSDFGPTHENHPMINKTLVSHPSSFSTRK